MILDLSTSLYHFNDFEYTGKSQVLIIETDFFHL